MEKKIIIAKIKEELKTEALLLRNLKQECKDGQRGTNKGPRVWQEDVLKAKWIWRHKHIAYCLLRGRKIEEIERKVHEHNKPRISIIDQYIEEFTKEITND